MGTKRRIPTVLVAVLHALIVAPRPIAASECRPIDQATQQPDFFSFRARLQVAVARRDASAVLSILDPSIRNTFGGDDGIEAFKRRWRIDSPDSELWEELGTVLAFGGFFEGPSTFVAPYTFRCGEEAFEDVVVLGSNVRLRAAPSERADVVGLLSFSVVSLASGYPLGPWAEVTVGDGRRGFVATRYIRSPIDYRALFVRSSNGWRMTALIAGD